MIPELAWTLLDDKPLFFKTPKHSAILCAWNGILMTKTYALLIQSLTWNKIFPTYEMKQSAWNEFSKLYGLGLFADNNWDDYILRDSTFETHHTNLINYMCKDQRDFLSNLSSKYTPQQALSWFMYSRTLTINIHAITNEPAF